jgi:hypothetical protein
VDARVIVGGRTGRAVGRLAREVTPQLAVHEQPTTVAMSKIVAFEGQGARV